MASVLEDGGRASDCGQIEVAEEAYTALPGDKRPSTNLSRIKIRPQRRAQTKIRAIEQFDARIIQPVIAGLEGKKGVKVLLLCDHFTPIAVRTHTDDPVPFLISSLDAEPKEGSRYNEAAAKASGVFFPEGHRLMEHFLK